MRGNTSRYPAKKPTAADNRTGMMLFLYGCRPSVLAHVTSEDLVARHGVGAKVAEYELIIARQKRAGEAS